MSDGWRQIDLWDVIRLISPDRPATGRWTWEKVLVGKQVQDRLVSAHGAQWDFRLNHGLKIKRVENGTIVSETKP